jgi:2-polyprenyl-3-methyl-5-hydroxy-6-metoxy-1,4-benzoquinol methylase
VTATSMSDQIPIRQIARPTCPVCGTDGERLYADLRDRLFAAPGVWSLVRCRNSACALVWLSPAPSAADLEQLYASYYTHSDVVAGRWAMRAARAIYRLCVDALLALIGVLAWKRRARLMFLDRDAPATLADIGCGDGSFLRIMADRGWQVAGVDFDAAAVAVARGHGLDVTIGTAESLLQGGRRFDVVTASHVIEHLPDPEAFLSRCRELLRPGGKIVLKTPNSASFGHRRYGRDWRGLEPPRHLQIFTRSALIACAGKARLRTSACFTTCAEAEWILIASHFLRSKGEYRFADLSGADLLKWLLLAPVLAVRAWLAWWLDRDSGEELCIILADAVDPAPPTDKTAASVRAARA